MSFMVAEPDPIPSEKRPLLLYKEQIIEKIDENPEIQTTLETYESMSSSTTESRHPCIGDAETVD